MHIYMLNQIGGSLDLLAALGFSRAVVTAVGDFLLVSDIHQIFTAWVRL